MRNTVSMAKACILGMGITVAMSSGATQVSTTGGMSIDLTNVSGAFNPGWLGSVNDYSSIFNLSSMLRGATLAASEDSNVTYSLVGYEAGFNNAFISGGQRLNNRVGSTPQLGTSFSFASAAGTLSYGFLSNGMGTLLSNGSHNIGIILSNNRTEALVLFNDIHRDSDFDDMVVRVSISPVPEPETFALLIGGLGLLAVVVRRRKNKSIAAIQA